MPQMHTIAMISSGFNAAGGICSVLHTIRDSQLTSRWDIKFVATYAPGRLSAILVAFISGMLRYILLCASRRVTITHIHSAARGSFWRKSIFLWLSRATGSKAVFHIHSGEFLDFYATKCGPLRQWFILRTLEASDVVVVLTPGWGEKIARLSPHIRLAIIPNPVAIPSPLPFPEPTAVRDCILFMGKINQKKGVFDLLQASADILRADRSLRLVCAGDGDIDGLRREAEAQGISAQLETPGWVEGRAKQDLFARCRVFSLPSYYEGLPICVLEAMAHGVPIVATRVGGIPEAVTDGTEGLLVPAGDERSLRDAIRRLLEDRPLAASLARSAQCRARRDFSVEAAVSRLEGLYRQLGASPLPHREAVATACTGDAAVHGQCSEHVQ